MMDRRINVGWVISDRFFYLKYYLQNRFRKNTVMRFEPSNWINKNCKNIKSELYCSLKKYDIVVFLKIMTDRAIVEAKKIKSYGGSFIFDANVNYYEIWGEYPIPGTKPTPAQKNQAIWMTENADFVVSDSAYLEAICRKYNSNVIWIPDNIDIQGQYSGSKTHKNKSMLTAIWSGIAKKAYHFELIENCLSQFTDRLQLIIVTSESDNNKLPKVIDRLKEKIRIEIRPFDSGRYHLDLLDADFIISPKILNNGYAVGHTEYKISLGMAQRLPVIASHQQSYIDAIGDSKAGFICKNETDWFNAFEAMLKTSPEQRQMMGDCARERILNNYSLDVISRKYASVLQELV